MQYVQHEDNEAEQSVVLNGFHGKRNMRRLLGPTKVGAYLTLFFFSFIWYALSFSEDPDMRPSEFCLVFNLLLLLLLIRVVLLFCMIPLCTDMGRRGTSY